MTTSDFVDMGQHAGEISPLCPAGHTDVLEWFAYLRENAPVYRDDQGRYILTRYEDVYAALRDPETFSSAHEISTTDVPEANQRWVVYSDDPDHLDIRQIVNRGWTPSAVAETQYIFEANADEFVGRLAPEEPFDVVQLGIEFAWHTFSDYCGLPREQHARMRLWSAVVGGMTGPIETRPPNNRRIERTGPPPGYAPGFKDAYADMEAYFKTLVARHRDHDPKFCKSEEKLPPFPRALIGAIKDHPERMNDFLGRVFPPMQAGGTSTVAHIFANTVDVMLERPEVWQMIRNDRSLIDPNQSSEVIEEILRLKSVHPGLNKTLTRDIELHGQVIPAGSMVQLYYLSGDHDGDAFEEPEEFRLRGISRHLAFGFGTHTCVGQSFARMALKIFLDRLLNRFESLERAPEPLSDWTFKGGYYTPDRLFVVGHALGGTTYPRVDGEVVVSNAGLRGDHKANLIF